MALVSGPGRAEGISDPELHSSKHVAYIKNLDTVRARKKMVNVN
jgi:geranylgeranyl transferase type-2 subunit beta